MTKKAFEKEHKHLVKVLKKGSKKEREKEGEDQENELENEKKAAVTRKKKDDAIVDRKDNYEKKPSEKFRKKRSTSNGYMPR